MYLKVRKTATADVYVAPPAVIQTGRWARREVCRTCVGDLGLSGRMSMLSSTVHWTSRREGLTGLDDSVSERTQLLSEATGDSEDVLNDGSGHVG